MSKDPQQEHAEVATFKLVGYCQSELDGNLKCRHLCNHCKTYYEPLQKEKVLHSLIKEKLKESFTLDADTLVWDIIEIIKENKL